MAQLDQPALFLAFEFVGERQAYFSFLSCTYHGVFRHSHMGEEGIKRDAQLRRQLERRWENMLERRAIRTGNWMDSSGWLKM